MMRSVLLQSEAVCVELSRFAPGEHHPRHADRHARITLALRGSFREEARASVTLGPGDVLFKSQAALHADWFGEAGATLASFVFQDDDAFGAAGWAGLWRPTRETSVLRLALATLEATLRADAAGVQTGAADLLASLDEPAPRRAAPAWLRRLREELADAGLASVDVAGRARLAGVHPTHASRLFRRCYGSSISEYAQSQGVRRAVRLLADERLELGDIALRAGFYDQSHMNRAFRRVLRRPPGAYRRMIARATAPAG